MTLDMIYQLWMSMKINKSQTFMIYQSEGLSRHSYISQGHASTGLTYNQVSNKYHKTRLIRYLTTNTIGSIEVKYSVKVKLRTERKYN